MIARIPIAHLHGGEATECVIDESIRHSLINSRICTLSPLKPIYRHRVIRLGEQPERVFQVGGLGIDCILRLELLDREALEAALAFKLRPRNLCW
ncbi:MAG: UDP-N-acetylglucosamine 2-epimerase [Lamprobacter sp.]|uniref:UDP-N-acetylglucosamine 2-epimerase n=1 Tax=Lamprobacter sp. TaxID=3100796 RepID=UPI002B25C718|nr:UDP-N-acetylglucosamine 2-epimerase [Lamprobacter sp.]MEA3643208.1 UDP-N-acetylglucosamine 2-epimerase [Lamprobacter sp.]